MKKIFGISLVALFAAVPMMAGAADLTPNTPADTDAQKVAAVSYVKGAYNAVASAVNTKQDQLKVGDADIDTAVVASSAISSTAAAANDGKLVTEKAVLTAIEAASSDLSGGISGLDTRLEAAESSITTLTGDADTNGSVRNLIAAEATARDEAISTAQAAAEAYADGLASNYDVAGAASAAQTAAVAAAKSYTDSAIEGLDATVSKTAGADGLAITVTEVDGVLTSVTGSIAANTYDTYGAAASAETAAKAYADSKFLTLTTNWTDETATSTVQLSNPSPAPAGSEVQS